MRILTLNYEYPPLGGGAGNATAALLGEFAKSPGVQIDLVTSSVGEARTESFSDSIRIHYLDIGKRGNLHYQTNRDLLAYSRKALRCARRLVSENEYDLCHAFFGIPCGYIARKLNSEKQGGLPYIVSLRGSDVPFYNERFRLLDRFVFRRLSARIWREAAAVVANSVGLKILALRSAPKQAVDVIPNGVDTNRFFPAPREEDGTLRVLCVSRLIARKGIPYLLAAVAKLRDPGIRLTLAGSGDLEDKLRKLARNFGLTGDSEEENRVRFLGYVAPGRIAEEYRRHDLFVLPSLNEGMSNTVLEAMASGLPILATETGGTAELLEEKENGYPIEKRSVESIEKGIARYKRSRDLVRRQGKRSREKAEAMSWEKTAGAYLDLYRKILSK